MKAMVLAAGYGTRLGDLTQGIPKPMLQIENRPILEYIIKVAPKKAFLVHGDDGAVAWFSQEITRRLPNTEVIIPQPGVEYEL